MFQEILWVTSASLRKYSWYMVIPRGMRQSLNLFAAWHMMCYTLVVCLIHLLNRLRRHLQTFPETFPVAFLLQTFPVVSIFALHHLQTFPVVSIFSLRRLQTFPVVLLFLFLVLSLIPMRWILLRRFTNLSTTNQLFFVGSWQPGQWRAIRKSCLLRFCEISSLNKLMLLFSLNVKNYLHGTFLLTPKLPLPFLSYHVILHLTPPPLIVFQLSLLLLPKFLPCWWYFNLCIYS